MKEKRKEIIIDIEKIKNERKIKPSHVLLEEIRAMISEDDKNEFKTALNELCKNDEIIYGKTINSFYFRCIEKTDKN